MTQQINWEQFEADYKPVKNHIDNNASYDGFMFETYGAELEAVQKAYKNNPDTVWTVIGDSGNVDVTSGFHLVNRLGYIITEVPAVGFTDVINEDYNEVKDFYSHPCPSCQAYIEGEPEVGDVCECGFVFDMTDEFIKELIIEGKREDVLNDMLDTCLNDSNYLKSLLQELLNGKSEEEINKMYDDAFGDLY